MPLLTFKGNSLKMEKKGDVPMDIENLEGYRRKCRQLTTLAEEDEVYLIWKRAYDENKRQFERFANRMPKRFRNILWCYAEGGRLMMQRLSNIACEQMEFLEEGGATCSDTNQESTQ